MHLPFHPEMISQRATGASDRTLLLAVRPKRESLLKGLREHFHNYPSPLSFPAFLWQQRCHIPWWGPGAHWFVVFFPPWQQWVTSGRWHVTAPRRPEGQRGQQLTCCTYSLLLSDWFVKCLIWQSLAGSLLQYIYHKKCVCVKSGIAHSQTLQPSTVLKAQHSSFWICPLIGCEVVQLQTINGQDCFGLSTVLSVLKKMLNWI